MPFGKKNVFFKNLMDLYKQKRALKAPLWP